MGGAKLEKVLSYRALFLITVNSILGTGIFFLPATAAGHAGPASLVSWAIMGVAAIFTSLCFAELTSMYPKAGGVYEFSKHAYGRFTSYVIGWTTLLAGNITIAMLVVGAIQYLLPVDLPLAKILISLVFIVLFNIVAYFGMRVSSFMLVTFACITVLTLLGLIVPSLWHINVKNFVPFFPFPPITIVYTIFLVAETFFGWETATFLAGETKDGARVVPKALIWSTVAIVFIALIFVATSIGVLPWDYFGQTQAPLADLAAALYAGKASTVFTLLVYLSIIGSVAGWVVSAPRLVLAMAQDKLFLSQFAQVHPKYKSPYKAIIFQTVVTGLLVIAGSGSYLTLLKLLVPLVLLLYVAIIVALIRLRYSKPNHKRYYTVPFGIAIPVATALFLVTAIIAWISENPYPNIRLVLLGGTLIIVGLPLYALLQMYYNPNSLRRFKNSIAILEYWWEDLFFPRKRRKELLNRLRLRNKSVLEVGCGVGTLTQHLAESVKPRGTVFAIEESQREAKIAQNRTKHHAHVTIQAARLHHLHKHFPLGDVAISVGQIGAMKRERELLSKLNTRLKMGAFIAFLDYSKFYSVLPNIEWLSDDAKVREVFLEAGFKVSIHHIRGLFFQYIDIRGRKVANSTSHNQ